MCISGRLLKNLIVPRTQARVAFRIFDPARSYGGALLGVQSWVFDDAGCLARTSATKDNPWTNEDHGYHAFRTMAQLDRRFNKWRRDIRAEVRMWGKLALHTNGMRAQRMRIVRLMLPKGRFELRDIAALRRKYRVPISFYA